jgi:pimeloyl-ACP methyl ester carboxylesterase
MSTDSPRRANASLLRASLLATALAVALVISLAVAAGGCRSRLTFAAEVPPWDAAVEAPTPDAPVEATPVPTWIDASPHLSENVDVDGVRLNYLDWGGVGPALVMVHGLGGNPHIFDDLAPLLRGRMHVLAVALRGHGESDAPLKGPYDRKTLSSDVGRLLDALHIDRAYLLGWSTGGDVVTGLAALVPDRVSKIVYLDGAYDWSDPTFLAELAKMVKASSAAGRDVASWEAYRAWFSDTWLGRQPWTSGLEAYLRSRVRLGEDGRVSSRMPGAVQKQTFDALAGPGPAYARVRAPALALYATSFFPVDSSDARHARLARDFEERVAGPWRAASIERAQHELRSGVTVRRLEGTTHVSIGLRDVNALAALIEVFLTGESDEVRPTASEGTRRPPAGP